MRTRTKVMIGIGIAILLVSAAGLSMNGRRQQGIEVRVETVDTRDLVATVTASGNVRARRKVDISSDISARVAELLVDEGQDVDEGQILLRLDPTRHQAAVNRSRANLSQAQAQVAQARANYLRAQREAERLDSLHAREPLLVSRQEVDNAQTDLEVQRSLLESSEFGVNQSGAALEEASDQLAKTIIRAPMAGRVTRLNVEEGETVIVGTMNNPGSLVLTVSDLSVMEVVLEVDETDVPEIALGDSATVDLDAFPDMDFPGVVTEIGNSAIRPPSQAAGTGQTPTIDFEVVVTLDSPEVELRPDLSATAELITETRAEQLSIPIIALTLREPESDGDEAENRNDRSAGEVPDPVEGVFVVRDGRVTFTPVTVGIAGQEYFEVLSGLSLGDTVVSGPYQVVRTLEDGDDVRADENDAPDAADDGQG
ncbi:MAG: efflux RND transporter periplasmic adaptor subunit [Gemmatimonadota bacterium]|nr:efflux RND transporter periplasmic adaptor subunit [Gemmatimonadota bacterium]